MKEIRVALLAFSVRGAMGQYLEALVPHLAGKTEVHLFVPDHFRNEVSPAIIHHFAVGETRRDALLRYVNPVSAKMLWWRVLSVRPTLVHFFNGEGYPWSLLIAHWASRYRIPVLLTLHDPELHVGASVWERANGALRRFTVPRSTSVHIHSRIFLESVRKLGARHIAVIPHGSIAQRFTKYQRPGIIREPIALFFGRLESYKGLDLLVEAGLKLEGQLRIVIAGPGHLPYKLKKIIRQHPGWFELRNRFIPDEEVADLFQRSRVLVLPYRQATQSSLPLIAAAFDVPVVATAVGAFIEDVPRVGGILVPPGDATALARGMVEAQSLSPLYPYELEISAISNKFVEWYYGVLEGQIVSSIAPK